MLFIIPGTWDRGAPKASDPKVSENWFFAANGYDVYSIEFRTAYVANLAASQFAGAKILSWSMNLTWLENAQARGFDEVILLNERGEVAECTSANLFVAQGNQVWTPPLSSGCLPGITREVLLGEIHVPGIEIGEKTLLPADLEKADEFFITSTTRDLLPVLQIEDKPTGRVETARVKLQKVFSEFVSRYVAEHAQVAK